MPAAAEIQSGAAAYLNGIQGAITMTGAATFNATQRSLTEEWKETEITAQNGATIEAIISSGRRRKYVMRFYPKGATRTAAEAVVDTVFALSPNAVITIAASTVSAFNGTYNYKGGASIEETSEGVAVCNINLEQYEDPAAGGSFAALPVVVG